MACSTSSRRPCGLPVASARLRCAAAAASSAVSAQRASPPASRTSWSSASSPTATGPAETARVGDGALEQRHVRRRPQRAQREQHAARQQRRDDGEVRVLRGGGDERDPAVLDRGSSASCWVLEKRCTSSTNSTVSRPPAPSAPPRVVDDLPDVLDAGRHRGQLDEGAGRWPGRPGRRAWSCRCRAAPRGAPRPATYRRRRPRRRRAGAAAHPAPSRWSWPTTSSSVRGRIRTASGAALAGRRGLGRPRRSSTPTGRCRRVIRLRAGGRSRLGGLASTPASLRCSGVIGAGAAVSGS